MSGRVRSPSDALNEITFDDVKKFIKSKNIRLTCSECGHDNSGLGFAQGSKFPTIIYLEQGDPDLSSAKVSFYFHLTCLNCGYTRMFDKGLVANWVAKNGDADVGI